MTTDNGGDEGLDQQAQEQAFEQQMQQLSVESILMPTREGNPFLSPKVSLDDEGYASHYWYIRSHEAATFGGSLDSRITDRNAESDSQNGVIFYAPKRVPHLKKVKRDHGKLEVKDSSGKVVAWLKGIPGKAKRIRSSKEPVVGAPEEDNVSADVWHEELEKAGLKDVSPDDLSKPENATKLRAATEAFKDRGPELFEEKRRWFPTPMDLKALKQAAKRPFFFVPNWLFDWCYIDELGLFRDRPDELVDYLFTGCDNDEELVSFIRSDEKPWDVSHQPPVPLVKEVDQFGVPSHKVPRMYEDERSISIRAHNRAVQFVLTAEDVYRWEEVTKRATGFYDNEDFFGGMENWQRSEDAFHDRITAQVTAGHLAKHTAQNLVRKFRKYYESWMEENYDRWLPSECYGYRDQFFDRISLYGPDWESRADAVWDVNSLQIFVISEPEVIGVFPDLVIDWTKFKAYVAPIENRRDIVRLYNHWKMAKNLRNTRASYDMDTGDIKNARRQDAGGPHTGIAYARRERRYLKLREAAGSNPKLRLKLLGPLWSKKQPWEPIDHDGALFSRYAQKPQSWEDGVKKIRYLSSLSGVAGFPIIKLLRERYLAEVRSYRSEWWWLQNDEYTARDPVDVWKNQGGLVTLSLLHENNNRLEGPFENQPQVQMTYANCTNIKAFIELMRESLPPAPIVEMVEEEIEAWEHDNVEHLRPELNKLMHGIYRSKGRHGLDKYFTGFYRRKGLDANGNNYAHMRIEDPDLEIRIIDRVPDKERPEFEVKDGWEWVKGWYEQSDERIWKKINWYEEMGSTKGNASGANGSSIPQISGWCKEGLGLGYGRPKEQQSRQERAIEIALKSGYWSEMKRILNWFSVRITAVHMLGKFDDKSNTYEQDKTAITLNELKMEVAGSLKGGKLLYFIARDTLWPMLRQIAPSILNEEFPFQQPEAADLDNKYVQQVLHALTGNDLRPTRVQAENDAAMKSWLNRVIAENFENFAEIVEGRHFENNHHHQAFAA